MPEFPELPNHPNDVYLVDEDHVRIREGEMIYLYKRVVPSLAPNIEVAQSLPSHRNPPEDFVPGNLSLVWRYDKDNFKPAIIAYNAASVTPVLEVWDTRIHAFVRQDSGQELLMWAVFESGKDRTLREAAEAAAQWAEEAVVQAQWTIAHRPVAEGEFLAAFGSLVE